MYLVYSKLTRDGYKLVRSREDHHYEACDESDDPSEHVDSDIDSKRIQPLFGSELMDFSKQYSAPASTWKWIKDLTTEVINSSVELSASYSKKRKAEDNLSSDGHSKQQKCFPEYNVMSPKYEADVDTDDIPEVIELEEQKVEETPKVKIFINPFHEDNEDSEESDEEEIIERADKSVVDLDEEDDAILITDEMDQLPIPGPLSNAYKERLIESQQKIHSMVALAIQHQVTAAEARQQAAVLTKRVEEDKLPTKLVKDPNQQLCKLCNVECNTEEMLRNHKNGKKHKKKLLKMMGSEGHDKVETFGCDICGIECTEGAALVAHFKGKKHLKAMTNRAELNSGSANAMRLSGGAGGSPDSDVMILTDKYTQPPITSEGADDDIELITGAEKTREEIFLDIPNCDPRSTLQLIKPLMYLTPSNTWTGSKNSRAINVPELFTSSNSRSSPSKSADNSVDALFSIDTNPSHEEVNIVEDDDDDEIILVEEETRGKKEKVMTPLTRPFRGLYPAKEYVTPLASVNGVYTTIRNFGFHIKPTKSNISSHLNTKSNVKQKTKKPVIYNTEEDAEKIMGIGSCDNSQGDGEQIDFDELAARAKAWIAQCNQRKESEKRTTNCDSNAGDQTIRDLSREVREWRKKNQGDIEEVVDIGSSDEEMSEEERSDSSSSFYSDDISAHSELRYFKHGPLASLWYFEDKVGPLICPEMAGSMREISNRLRMEPPETVFRDNKHCDKLGACYDVFLAENYKKNSNTPPDYRVVIQSFSSSLPSAQSLCHLDRMYPDLVPFLFAIVSGGTVSFLSVDRVDLPSYYNSI